MSVLRLQWPVYLTGVVRIGVCLGVVFLLASPAQAKFEPAIVFETACSGCHSVGKGDVVGPDLKGVTARHDASWLHAFIRSSQSLVRRREKAAVALFEKYKKRMPDHDFTDQEIDVLLAFIQAGGPRGAGEVRSAAAATAAEVAHGRDLFTGALPFARGGAACIQCHAAGEGGRWRAGTLAGDLSRIYVKYQDVGLARALAESHYPLMTEAYRGRPLTPEEVFAVKAFLNRTARSPAVPDEPLRAGGLLFLGLGSSSLALWFVHLVRGRRGPGGVDLSG
jgi:cytochrome c2